MESPAHLSLFYVALGTLVAGGIGGIFLASASDKLVAFVKKVFHV